MGVAGPTPLALPDAPAQERTKGQNSLGTRAGSGSHRDARGIGRAVDVDPQASEMSEGWGGGGSPQQSPMRVGASPGPGAVQSQTNVAVIQSCGGMLWRLPRGEDMPGAHALVSAT